MEFQHKTNTILKHIICCVLCHGITKVRRRDTETYWVVSHVGTLKQTGRECRHTNEKEKSLHECTRNVN